LDHHHLKCDGTYREVFRRENILLEQDINYVLFLPRNDILYHNNDNNNTNNLKDDKALVVKQSLSRNDEKGKENKNENNYKNKACHVEKRIHKKVKINEDLNNIRNVNIIKVTLQFFEELVETKIYSILKEVKEARFSNITENDKHYFSGNGNTKSLNITYNNDDVCEEFVRIFEHRNLG